MALSAPDLIRMSGLLEEALPLDAAGRQAWLEGLPPKHQDLAPALRKALLTENGQVPLQESLANLPGIGPGIGTSSKIGVKPQDRIGAYRVIRELGSGGMAEVWLAERADDAFQREVALKLPKQIWQRQDLAQRFTRERNILAGLEHPHIARLYDAGFTGEGLPYIALEYVPGQPLTDWCDQQKLGVRERLQLFLQVLDAVHYAHERQVIHRDLKPSNILITAAGQVKLLDFGIAKLLTDDNALRTQITELYGRALTPSYASPELLKGDELTAASDIYSLGVLLYEVLTGKRPYQLKAQAFVVQLEQAIVATPIQPPSTQINTEAAPARATTPGKLTRRLRGDLDAIVMKALAKPPGDRYATASAFAEDIQRHLAGETIEARPNHPFYRFGKFIRRHRRGAAMATASMAVVAGAVGYVLMRPPSPDPMAVAKNAAPATLVVNNKSIAVLPFVDMSEKHDQEYFSDGMSEELIDHLTRYADLKVIARTSSFYFKGKNEDMRTIASKLGVTHLLEGSVRKSGNALRITAQLIRASDGTHLWSQTYDRKLSDIFKVQDDVSEQVVQALKGALTAGTGMQGQTASLDAYNAVLKANFIQRRFGKGDQEQALALYQEATRLDPAYALAWAKVAKSYVNLSYFGTLPISEAEPKALSALERASSLDPNLAYAHRIRGEIYRDFDWNWKAARSEFERAIELDPSNSSSRESLGYLTWIETGDINDEISLLRQDLARDPLDADALFTLGESYWAARRYQDSADSTAKLLELNPNHMYGVSMYALALSFMGQNDKALASIEMLNDEEEKLSALPCIYWRLGRRAESDASMKKLMKLTGTNSPAYTLAQMHACRGETQAAVQSLQQAYRQHENGMQDVKFEPFFVNLQNDTGYHDILVKMKLAD